MAGTELVAVRRGRGILDRFLWPLCFGTGKVALAHPLTRAAVDQLLSEAAARSSAIHDLEVGLQQLADQLVPHGVDIRVDEDDLRLVVAAYHVAFQLHHSVSEGKIWDRRLQNLDDEVWKILARVPVATTEGQLLARHLMLRHLPVAYRIDTRVEFGAFWGPLTFRGQEASWVQLPLRKHHHIEKSSVWLGADEEERQIGNIYARLLALSPVTKLVHIPTLGPRFTWEGCVAALAAPGPCRLVTNTVLNEGLPHAMPHMGHAFIALCTRASEPVSHKRYLGRFLLNLALTYVTFASEEELDTFPALKDIDTPPPPGVPAPRTDPISGRQEHEKRRRAMLLGRAGQFYGVIDALHRLRGPLGAAHLYAEPELEARVQRFIGAANLDKTKRVETFQIVANGLQYPLL